MRAKRTRMKSRRDAMKIAHLTRERLHRLARSLNCAVFLWVAMIYSALSQTPDSFNPGPNNSVNALALQTDGKILVGGTFTNLGGQARYFIARLNQDGTVDSAFNNVANSSVNCLSVQTDGTVIVGGSFTSLPQISASE